MISAGGVAWGEVGTAAAAALAFFAVLAAFGARLRRWLRLPAPPGIKLPLDLTIGIAGWSFFALILGLLGALASVSLLVLTGFFVLVGKFRATGWRGRPLLASAFAAVPLLPLALAPPFFYDSLVYHLALPWQALLEGGWRGHPETIFASFPPLAQLVYLPFLAVGAHRACGAFHLLTFVAAGGAVAALVRRHGRSSLGQLAGAALVLMPLYLLVPAFPAAEGFAVLPLTVALALALNAPEHRLPVAFLAGLAVAARLQALPIAGLLLFWTLAGSRGLGTRLAAGGLFAGGASPWWVKNAALLGKPLWPLGWDGPGKDVLDRDAVRLFATTPDPMAALQAIAATLAPHLAYLLPLLLAFGLSMSRALPRPRTLLLTVGLGGTVAWPWVGLLTRFLAPAVPAVVSGAAVGRSRAARVASSLALGITVAVGAVLTGQKVLALGGSQLLGQGLRVARHLVVNDPFPAFALAANLPADAKVLFVGEPRGFLFPRPFLAPSYLDPSPLVPLTEGQLPPEEWASGLRSQGFTHLLVNWGELSRLAAGYPCAPWVTPRGRLRFQAWVQLLGPPVLVAGPVSIYSLF